MTAAVTNDLKIVYGGMTIGDTTDYLIVGPMRLEWGNVQGGSFRKAAVECTVLVTGTPYATFVANRIALETVFSVWRGRLQVILGGTTHIDLNPATNTGFNHAATCRDLGDDWDTGSSRAYLVRIEADLPSTNANALADFAVEIAYTPAGRRKVIFTGTYTASGANSALVQYRAQITAQANTFLDTLTASPITGGSGNATFEVIGDDANPDYENKICPFTRTYLEVISNQAAGTLNDSEIVNPTVHVEVRNPGPGDSVGPNPSYSQLPKDLGPQLGFAIRPTEITVNYEAWLTGTNALAGRWASKIKPLLYQVLAAYGAGNLAILEETPNYLPDDNRVTAVIRALAFNSRLLELEITVDDEQEFGAAVDPTWGDPYDADVAQGPARYTRTITRTSRTVGPVGLFDEIGLANPPGPASEGWVSLGRKRRPRTKKVGLASSGKQVFVTDTIDVELLRYVKKPVGANSPNKTITQSGLGINPAPAAQQTQQSASSPTPGAPVATTSGLNP